MRHTMYPSPFNTGSERKPLSHVDETELVDMQELPRNTTQLRHTIDDRLHTINDLTGTNSEPHEILLNQKKRVAQLATMTQL